MKRSHSIKLVLIGASLFSLTACDQANKTATSVFRSEEECHQLSHADPSVCTEAMKTAKEEHVKTAPRYISMMECEEKFGVGNCVNQPDKTQSSSHHGVFMPMMMGFMIGNMMNAHSAQPVYRDKSSNLYSKGAQFRSNATSNKSGGFGNAGRFRSASS